MIAVGLAGGCFILELAETAKTEERTKRHSLWRLLDEDI